MCIRDSARPVRPPEMDRGVERLIREIERKGPRGEIHDQFGVARGQARQPGRKPAHAEARQGRDAQFVGRSSVSEARRGPPDAIECRPDILGISPPLGIQADPPPRAREQRRLKPILEQRDLTADRTLGQAHFLTRPREAPQSGSSRKTVERAHWRQ